MRHSGFRNLFRHLCIVASHYNSREAARLHISKHLERIGDTGLSKEMNDLTNRMNKLLDSEIKVAELGKTKSLKSDIVVVKHGHKTLKRLKKVEKGVDKKYKEKIVHEIKDKVFLLESEFKTMKNDKTIHPIRLRRIKEKITILKKRLRMIS